MKNFLELAKKYFVKNHIKFICLEFIRNPRIKIKLKSLKTSKTFT